jgi:hypothetical protein
MTLSLVENRQFGDGIVLLRYVKIWPLQRFVPTPVAQAEAAGLH